MPGEQIRFRQVHLDFHTSEHITAIGSRFDPDEFADTLVRAHVDSITCFARCHHGWLYYDSPRFPERRHPHLERNLLWEQIDACHARGIRVPVYTTIQWDHLTAREHPEWLALDEQGRPYGYTPSPFQAGFYRFLCVNSPYLDFLKAHIQDIFEALPVDGLFLDINEPLDDCSRWAREGMEAAGLDPTDPLARQAYGRQVIAEFQREMTAFIRQFSPDCTIFYNAGHVGPRHRAIAGTYTHFEIESLPSGQWGYAHFPLSARYARNLGLPVLGMTGKFHTAWGDFHSFKNPAALQYECFRMLALGAACSIGDQLHPEGQICQTTYELIGGVYGEVAAKEPYCVGASAVVDIAVMTPEAFTFERMPAAAAGAMQMLQEAGHQFDVIDPQSDLIPYRVVILPDAIPVDAALTARLQAYLDQGGAILASFESGLDTAKQDFVLTALGVRRIGPAPYSPDFILPAADMTLPQTEHVMYLRGLEVEVLPGSQVISYVTVPYFNRSYQHFCSHQHTPSSGAAGYPAIVQRDRAVYFAHPIFTQYHQRAPHWCKQFVMEMLERLLPVPLVEHDGPSTLMVTLNEQAEYNRRVLHALHYIPTRTSQEIDIVEDVIPLYDISFTVREDRPVMAVRCVPEDTDLVFEQSNGLVRFTLPVLRGHQMIMIAYPGE